MILHFPREQVDALIAHTRAARRHKQLNDDKDTKQPGLWLVADTGVYLMSNGLPKLSGADGENDLVAYAKEVNPKTMAFDAWWPAKTASFGGDDGIEYLSLKEFDIALASYPADADLEIDVTETQLGIMLKQTQKPASKSPKKP